MDLRDNISAADCKLSDNHKIAKQRAKDVRDIVDRRIDFITTPVYMAAYALNPRYRTPEFPEDITDALQEVLNKLLGEVEGIKAYSVFQSEYLTGRKLSTSMCRAANMLEPHEWWRAYGGTYSSLGNVAMRLLSQVPSASACERNWSAYEFVHCEKRNRLGKKRARDLVSVFRNLIAIKSARAAEVKLAKHVSLSSSRHRRRW